MRLALLLLAACATEDLHAPIVVELGGDTTVTFDVDGSREVELVVTEPTVIEAWAEGGAFATGAWIVPHVITEPTTFAILANGTVELAAYNRGTPPPPVSRDRGLAWFDPALLDDPTVVSFAGVMAAISDDHHGGRLLERWFQAFAAGPGAGRATFAQWLGEIRTQQGTDPTAWQLAALPMKITGVHHRHDLGRDVDCGELRVSIASAHPTFSPVHFIFLFRAAIGDDDVTPDGIAHCRGAARRWARFAELDPTAWHAAARDLLAVTATRENFLLVESVELSLSPWQWRQWQPDGHGGLANPLLFQTLDVARVNAAGPLRDAFLADVAANTSAIAARTWTIPAQYRSTTAEVQPNEQAPLVDLAGDATLPRALGMVGCPRCHTDDADFLQTGFDRMPSPFYDRELDARKARLDALAAGAFPPAVPFGPLSRL
ncbi:MAG: hypothetical protein ABI867_15465 [Kofleriaceae bacterium]